MHEFNILKIEIFIATKEKRNFFHVIWDKLHAYLWVHGKCILRQKLTNQAVTQMAWKSVDIMCIYIKRKE